MFGQSLHGFWGPRVFNGPVASLVQLIKIVWRLKLNLGSIQAGVMRAAPVLPNGARPLLHSQVTFGRVLHHWSENDHMTSKGERAAVKPVAG